MHGIINALVAVYKENGIFSLLLCRTPTKKGIPVIVRNVPNIQLLLLSEKWHDHCTKKKLSGRFIGHLLVLVADGPVRGRCYYHIYIYICYIFLKVIHSCYF